MNSFRRQRTGNGGVVATVGVVVPMIGALAVVGQASAQNPGDRRASGGGATDAAIRPFRVNVSEEDLGDLRRRIKATKWPEKETVADQSQGVTLATIQELARYWASEYD